MNKNINPYIKAFPSDSAFVGSCEISFNPKSLFNKKQLVYPVFIRGLELLQKELNSTCWQNINWEFFDGKTKHEWTSFNIPLTK